jgi:hypothetical protein
VVRGAVESQGHRERMTLTMFDSTVCSRCMWPSKPCARVSRVPLVCIVIFVNRLRHNARSELLNRWKGVQILDLPLARDIVLCSALRDPVLA